MLGGAATGAAAVLAGCSKKTGTSDDAAGEPQVIKDDSKIVSITDEYEAVDIDLEPAASWTLPLGTLLYYCDGDYAAAMMAPVSALHANTLGVLNLGDGSLTTLIEDPIEGTGYAFYDVRAGDGVFAWVEMNFANASWKLYAQNLAGSSLTGNAVELDRGGETTIRRSSQRMGRRSSGIRCLRPAAPRRVTIRTVTVRRPASPSLRLFGSQRAASHPPRV
ncbi:MAG: hypothetical protein ACLTYW_11685 [Collinsella sp.]